MASKPSDSAFARMYDTSMAAAMTATGSIMVLPGSVLAKCQAMPPNSRASVIRSETESKKAPRFEEVPEAFATAPSRASGIPVRTRNSRPNRRYPSPMLTAAAVAITIPVTVTASAEMPVRRRLRPMGVRPRSTAARQFPSSM